MRIQKEEEERQRIKREKEAAELLRIQNEEEERLRLKREADQKQLKEEEEEKQRIKREKEAAELLRIQKEEEERQRLKREREAAELMRIQKEEEERQRIKREKEAAELMRIQNEEEERKKQMEEIESTQNKVRELKEQLQKSRVEPVQTHELVVVKKTERSAASNRYALGDSNESEGHSKKGESQRASQNEGTWELKTKAEVKTVKVSSVNQSVNQSAKPVSKEPSKAPSKQTSKVGQKSSNISEVSKGHRKSEIVKKSGAFSDIDPKSKVIKYDGKNAGNRKSELVYSSQAGQKESNTYNTRVKETNITTTHNREIHESEIITINQSKYTKIELNLENSEDDIDFVGYGQMKVNSKKERSASPNVKQNFLKISPARNIAAEISKREERVITTRAFTPMSKTSEIRETREVEVVSSTNREGRSTSHARYTTSGDLERATRYRLIGDEHLTEDERSAITIQYHWRFRIFRIRLLNSRDYHNELASRFTQEELFDKYLLFVRSLPMMTFTKKSFTIFIATIVDFKDEE